MTACRPQHVAVAAALRICRELDTVDTPTVGRRKSTSPATIENVESSDHDPESARGRQRMREHASARECALIGAALA